ncbi:aminotransferase class IV [Synechococcus sp. PCC 6312]|uniref:aminotransferase class IV n=1 Tax=Synechococcus sp. (strain ATCC 27167 / PCC 6312) TaxID=195253 RepID=UPI00029F37BD|nr:aminotransferase class IV [Synechococcus sp. PCC 6312]AFY59799.1 branched-chain amino acid aminotransferase/4-amino-4-deoxychorismate lyase [Synechococcus sp. PCC 6312]
MGMLINLDGEISTNATISVLDRGFLYGDSVYEVVRTFQGKPFGLVEHLARLKQSAAYLYLSLPWLDEYIIQEVNRTLAAAGPGEYYIRIVVTRGADPRIGLLPQAETKPRLLIALQPIAPEPQLSSTGLRVTVPPRQRVSLKALDPAAKTGNYLNNILALLEAQANGADDAILLNPEGAITEATTSNLWIVRKGMVETPTKESGILHGITRQFLLDILCEKDIPHQERELFPVDLVTADEAFLSSSVRLLMPIAQVDDYPFPECPGPVTKLLWTALIAKMAQTTAS